MKKKFKWREGAATRSALCNLTSKRKEFDRVGKLLLAACDGHIFPADLYFIATCNRALQNFDCFALAMKADYYSTSMILLRVQLDSVLRCYGVTQSKDAHAIAKQVLDGLKLSKLKDGHGQAMTDSNLVESFCKLSEANKVVRHIYNLTSSYVHLSASAMHHVLEQSKPMAGGTQGFFIGSAQLDVPTSAKLQLIQAFQSTTNALFDLARNWANVRDKFGSVEALAERYGPDSAIL